MTMKADMTVILIQMDIQTGDRSIYCAIYTFNDCCPTSGSEKVSRKNTFASERKTHAISEF